MQKTEGGVVISGKDMYKLIQRLDESVNRLENNLGARFAVLEEKVENSIKADERSREALEKAKDAEEEAKNAHKRIKRIEDKIDKLMISIILALATGAIGALFYFAQKGMGG